LQISHNVDWSVCLFANTSASVCL